MVKINNHLFYLHYFVRISLTGDIGTVRIAGVFREILYLPAENRTNLGQLAVGSSGSSCYIRRSFLIFQIQSWFLFL